MPVALDPMRLLLLQKLRAANTEVQWLNPGCSGALSQLITNCIPSGKQHRECSLPDLWSKAARQQVNLRHNSTLSKAEWEFLRTGATYSSGPTSSSSEGSSGRGAAKSSAAISASCDVPPNHPLHDLYRSRQQYTETTGSNTALYKLPSRISTGTIPPEEFHHEDHVLSRFYEEGVHGGLGRRFRRKVPLFQVCAGDRRTMLGACSSNASIRSDCQLQSEPCFIG